MRIRAFLLLSLLIFTTSCITIKKVPEIKEINSRFPVTSILMIESIKEVSKDRFKIFSATGVVFEESASKGLFYVLTARHFCREVEQENGIYRGANIAGREYRMKFLFSMDEKNIDACVLVTYDNKRNLRPVSIARYSPFVGDKVFNSFASKITPNSKFELIINSGYFSSQNEFMSIYTIPVIPGSSGSPILNEKKDMVGMVWGFPLSNGSRILENISYSISYESLKKIHDYILSIDPYVDSMFTHQK